MAARVVESFVVTRFRSRICWAKANHGIFHCQQPGRKIFPRRNGAGAAATTRTTVGARREKCARRRAVKKTSGKTRPRRDATSRARRRGDGGRAFPARRATRKIFPPDTPGSRPCRTAKRRSARIPRRRRRRRRRRGVPEVASTTRRTRDADAGNDTGRARRPVRDERRRRAVSGLRPRASGRNRPATAGRRTPRCRSAARRKASLRRTRPR